MIMAQKQKIQKQKKVQKQKAVQRQKKSLPVKECATRRLAMSDSKQSVNLLTYDDLRLPFYRNTRTVFANLDATDLAKAAVISYLNLMLVGDTGTGKTQLAKDIFNYYYGGNHAGGGLGIFIRAHPDIDIYNEIFSQLNIALAQRELNDSINAVTFMVDELDRAPAVAQNQFFGLGDGIMDYRGRAILIGRDGHHQLIATANIGNGEFQGTFDPDKALYNRLHVTIDFDHPEFKPTVLDFMHLDRSVINPNVKEAESRNIFKKLAWAKQQIDEMVRNPGIEALAVLNFLRFGLDSCRMTKSCKDKSWPACCHDCGQNNKNGDVLCALVRAPVRRTQEAMLKYACALHFLAQLKDPTIEVDTTELMFFAFSLTGAYKSLLNPMVLKQGFGDQPQRMMTEVVQKLKAEYHRVEDYIMVALDGVESGKKMTRFYEHKAGSKKGMASFDSLCDELKKSKTPLEPFNDEHEIGMSWMEQLLDFLLEDRKKK
jgi:hypothetical protein